MTTGSLWHASAALGWLTALLQERLGGLFDLQLHADHAQVAVRLPNESGEIILALNGANFARADSSLPCAHWDAASEGWQPALGQPLHAPGAATLPAPLIQQTASGNHIQYDILGLTYWMLTRQEEIGRTDLDEHGRFPATASHAYKHGYLERPIVDEWLDILRQVIERTWPGIQLEQPQFSMKVSHDVDAPARYGFRPWRGLLRGMAGDLLKRRDARGLLAPWIRLQSRERLHPWDSNNTFDWIMDVSERHGLQSAFYFICGGRGTPFNPDYEITWPAIRQLVRHIHARGHEVGLHPSYGSYLDPARIAEEAARLRNVCAQEGVDQPSFGGRMHYLQWRQPDTLRAWDAAGMAYDSTMTYADHAGFRCGTCFEYPAFDPVAQQPLKLRIRPLVVMEGSVFGENYMNLGVTDAAQAKMLELTDACRKVGGCFTLLWHNSSLVTKGERTTYESVIAR